MNDLSIIIVSCDSYDFCWEHCIYFLNKYWENHPKTYLVTETKTAPLDVETININSEFWTKRLREALKQIETKYVLTILDDFFIREPVKIKKIQECLKMFDENTACFNFERNYREALPCNKEGFFKQKNGQMYLNSCQPSIWNKEKLLFSLREDESPWSWEMKEVSSDYDYYISKNGDIINVGYSYGKAFSVCRGQITEEVQDFFRRENYKELRK